MARHDAIQEPQGRGERELVQRTLRGEQAAFGELVRRYEGPVINLAHRIVRDREESEDVAQEAFLKAYAALDRYDTAYPFRVWLFRIAYNVAIDHIRKRRGGVVSFDAPRPGHDEEGGWEIADPRAVEPDTAVEARDRRDRLDMAIAKLPPALRAAIVLRHVEEMTYEEIAETLGVPLGTVKIRIHRGREALAKILRRDLGDQEIS